MSKETDRQKRQIIKEQLGVSPGAARNKLIQKILFALAKELGKDVCFQCGEKIENEREFSVEHKVPWLGSADPQSVYFDLNNIAFSHLRCNIVASRNGLRVRAKSGFKGVAYYPERSGTRKWRAQRTSVNEGTVYIGWYETGEEAAAAYDAAVIEALRENKLKSIVTNKDLGLIDL